MSSPQAGDGERPAGVGLVEPDAHGQAALLLTESLIHMLVERGALTATEAALVVQTAAEVKAEVATLAGESAERMNASLDLLARIGRSLAADGQDDGSGA